MKKSLLSGLFLLLCCAAWGQKRTVDPVRNDYVYVVRFDRIETTKERTVAEVTLRNDPASWIRYDTGCYLRERGGDRRYRLLAAEGFELGKEVFLPAPGVSKARFVFEPLDADVRCVDFLGRQKPLENTYGIWLKDAPSPLPAWAAGHWMTSDGSNRWVCGFLPQTAVWRNDFWDYGTVTRKGKTLWVQLKNGDRDTTLCLKEGRDGALLLGSDGRTFATLGRDLVRRTTPAAEWKYDPEKYRNELYRPGTAVIRGILEGYTPQFGFTSGTLMSYDPITRRDCAALIEVLPDGRFSAEIETEHPKTLVMSLGTRNDQEFVRRAGRYADVPFRDVGSAESSVQIGNEGLEPVAVYGPRGRIQYVPDDRRPNRAGARQRLRPDSGVRRERGCRRIQGVDRRTFSPDGRFVVGSGGPLRNKRPDAGSALRGA